MPLGGKAGSVHLKPLWLGEHAHGTQRRHWRRLQKKAIQCWLVQDGFDVHKLPTWIEGWCSMKTKRHLLAYQLHGKQWHFPFGSAWPSSKREEHHRSRSEVTLWSECLLHVVCIVKWFAFFNVDFVPVFVNTSQKADSNMEQLNHSNYSLNIVKHSFSLCSTISIKKLI